MMGVKNILYNLRDNYTVRTVTFLVNKKIAELSLLDKF